MFRFRSGTMFCKAWSGSNLFAKTLAARANMDNDKIILIMLRSLDFDLIV